MACQHASVVRRKLNRPIPPTTAVRFQVRRIALGSARLPEQLVICFPLDVAFIEQNSLVLLLGEASFGGAFGFWPQLGSNDGPGGPTQSRGQIVHAPEEVIGEHTARTQDGPQTSRGGFDQLPLANQVKGSALDGPLASSPGGFPSGAPEEFLHHDLPGPGGKTRIDARKVGPGDGQVEMRLLHGLPFGVEDLLCLAANPGAKALLLLRQHLLEEEYSAAFSEKIKPLFHRSMMSETPRRPTPFVGAYWQLFEEWWLPSLRAPVFLELFLEVAPFWHSPGSVSAC